MQNASYLAITPEQQVSAQEQHPMTMSSSIRLEDSPTVVVEEGIGVDDQAWGDGMMWQLFQAQPSLEWFNSEILDPEMWDLNMPG